MSSTPEHPFAPPIASTSWWNCCGCRTCPGPLRGPRQDVYEAIKTSFADLRDHIKKHVGPALEWGDPDSLIAAAGRSLQFARLALAVRREHERLKRRRRGLDFDDLLVRARDLLRHHPELAIPEAAAAGSTAIEFVLVDEFQDTDGIQGEILRLLSGAAFKTGRLFVVGDMKQSIYRFRGAEPGIFRDWRSEFPAHGAAQPDRELPQRARHHRLRQRAVRRLLPRPGSDGVAPDAQRLHPVRPRTPASPRSSSSGRRPRNRRPMRPKTSLPRRNCRLASGG